MSRITVKVGAVDCSARLLVTVDAYARGDFHPNGFSDHAGAVKTRIYKSKRDLAPIWSNCLNYNAAPVRHFHYARRVDSSCFHAEPLRLSSATTREMAPDQGRPAVEGHLGPERTLGTTYPQ
jgi:hypothetical protein